MSNPSSTSAGALMRSIEVVCNKYGVRPFEVPVFIDPPRDNANLFYATWSDEKCGIVIRGEFQAIPIYKDYPGA